MSNTINKNEISLIKKTVAKIVSASIYFMSLNYNPSFCVKNMKYSESGHLKNNQETRRKLIEKRRNACGKKAFLNQYLNMKYREVEKQITHGNTKNDKKAILELYLKKIESMQYKVEKKDIRNSKDP